MIINPKNMKNKKIIVKYNKNNNNNNNNNNKISLEEDNSNNNNKITLIKKYTYNFPNNNHLFKKGHESIPEEQLSNKYYYQRYYYFSLFDSGIKMDEESWYSVTPEEISIFISNLIKNSSEKTILDAFCGCGGNTIQFSKNFKKVIANDISENKINLTINNVKVYNKNVNNVEYKTNDFLTFNSEEKIDYIFLSPPWGGKDYINDKEFTLKKWVKPDIEKIIEKSLSLCNNLIFYLPRNTNINELINYIFKYDKNNIENDFIYFEEIMLNSANKIKAILILYGKDFNHVNFSDIKLFLCNNVFNKKISKVNSNKIKNIIKVIGFDKFIKILFDELDIDLKEDKLIINNKNNLKVNKIIQFFIKKIFDENELNEYNNILKEENNKKNDKNIQTISINFDNIININTENNFLSKKQFNILLNLNI